VVSTLQIGSGGGWFEGCCLRQETLLPVVSCYRNRDKLYHVGLLGSSAILPYYGVIVGGTLDCNFDVSPCGWQQSFDDDLDWNGFVGPSPTWLTGPDYDHTFGGGNVSFSSSTYQRCHCLLIMLYFKSVKYDRPRE